MSRGHVPYGYRIENGAAVINEIEAEQVSEMYRGYLSGLSLTGSAKAAGLVMKHGSAKGILGNPHYIGDGFYPAIIDRETFGAFETERKRRAEVMGRSKKVKKTVAAKPAPVAFRLREDTQCFSDPYKQAEYMYSLIESEA